MWIKKKHEFPINKEIYLDNHIIDIIPKKEIDLHYLKNLQIYIVYLVRFKVADCKQNFDSCDYIKSRYQIMFCGIIICM